MLKPPCIIAPRRGRLTAEQEARRNKAITHAPHLHMWRYCYPGNGVLGRRPVEVCGKRDAP